MLSKRSIKIISIVLVVAMLFMTVLNTTVLAGVADEIGGGITGENPFGDRALTLVRTILNGLKWIGIAISIGMLIYIGIKYVTSSPEGKANIKGILGTYILGFALIAFATTIVGILETALK